MTRTFGRLRAGRISWGRELPPVLLVAGLAADYLSPPALWTILLPFGFVVLLMTLRKWGHAAAMFVLSSWVLVPTVASAVSSVEEMRGERRLYVIPGEDLSTLREAVTDPDVPASVGFQVLPVGPEHVINPRWAFRRIVVTFAELHNAMLIDHWRDAALDPSLTLDRIWIDEMAQSPRDAEKLFVAVTSEAVGAFRSESLFEDAYEAFTYEARGDELRVLYPKTGEREKIRVRAWRCKESGMDYCLELSAATRGVKRYLSKAGMEIGAVASAEQLRERLELVARHAR